MANSPRTKELNYMNKLTYFINLEKVISKYDYSIKGINFNIIVSKVCVKLKWAIYFLNFSHYKFS
jgi:hypothetical protein